MNIYQIVSYACFIMLTRYRLDNINSLIAMVWTYNTPFKNNNTILYTIVFIFNFKINPHF